MSSSNRLEIISRGSVEMLSQSRDSSMSSELTGHTATAIDMKSDECAHTGLEPLPPERPRYSAQGSPEDLLTQAEEDAFPHYLDTATRELAHSQLQTESLLQRIETLSGRIKSGLSLVEGTGTTVPTLPLISADDVMMTSSENSHTGERPCGEDRPHSETSGGGEDGERDGGEIEGEESYPVPEVDPKLVKALEKMRRLDERLADIVKRERDVKEQRKQLEMQITGVTSPLTDGEGVLPPVFQTQTLEDGAEYHGEGSMPLSANDTDFIQSNIEEAGEVLSEAERYRLEQLLAEDESPEREDCHTVSDNTQGNVFTLSPAAKTALRNIDNQLQALNRQSSVCGTSTFSDSNTSSSELKAQWLMEIDEKLAALQNQTNDPSSPAASHVLSPSMVHHLLEQCAREQRLS